MLAMPQADVPMVPCVVITNVKPESPAKAGLTADMFITHVDHDGFDTRRFS